MYIFMTLLILIAIGFGSFYALHRKPIDPPKNAENNWKNITWKMINRETSTYGMGAYNMYCHLILNTFNISYASPLYYELGNKNYIKAVAKKFVLKNKSLSNISLKNGLTDTEYLGSKDEKKFEEYYAGGKDLLELFSEYVQEFEDEKELAEIRKEFLED